jgi:hypothetical protein
VVFENVIRIEVRDSGKHRIEIADGRTAFVAAGPAVAATAGERDLAISQSATSGRSGSIAIGTKSALVLVSSTTVDVVGV